MRDLQGENSAENNSTDILLNAAREASSSLLPVKTKHKLVDCYAVMFTML
jgi:hypothetical protein